tara:strand:+ start:148 stop:888 length:741 start_codon:yes stop_codon:yes gene_type:complete
MIKDKIYFASDFHLGSPNFQASLNREKKIIRWLNTIEKDAKSIYLMGDIFDFWFEYKKVVPKGFVRLFGKIAELTDKGIDIIFFTGNHDMWVSDYFQKELGISVIKKECIVSISGVKLFIGHGDGLGNGDNKYKILKNIFKSKVCNWLFSRIHPNLGLLIGQKWSLSSSKSQNNQNINKLKNNQLINYSKQQQKLNKVDYYIFGHTHSPLEIDIDSEYKYVNLGDWINYNTYAVLYQKSLKLKTFK